MGDPGSIVEKLISNLLSNPKKFINSGASYPLLQEYFAGEPVVTLMPLLRHSDPLVQRVAIWVASELGVAASPVLHDTLPLLESEDRYLTYHALEVIAVCAFDKDPSLFMKVVIKLQSHDHVLRVLAMRLIGNAGEQAVQKVIECVGVEDRNQNHVKYLARLVNAQKQTTVEAMLLSKLPLERLYGAILARWMLSEQPQLILNAALTDDEDVRGYAEEVIDMYGLG